MGQVLWLKCSFLLSFWMCFINDSPTFKSWAMFVNSQLHDMVKLKKYINLLICTCIMHNSMTRWSNALYEYGDTLQIVLVTFWGEVKTGLPWEKPLREMMRTNNKLNPHMMPNPVIEPEPHWWEASALNIALSLQGWHYHYEVWA